MTITGEDRNGGDPDKFCGRLVVETNGEGWDEDRELALLKRTLDVPERRRRLIECAERIEAEDLAAADPVFT
jgi:hypothetical protein